MNEKTVILLLGFISFNLISIQFSTENKEEVVEEPVVATDNKTAESVDDVSEKAVEEEVKKVELEKAEEVQEVKKGKCTMFNRRY